MDLAQLNFFLALASDFSEILPVSIYIYYKFYKKFPVDQEAGMPFIFIYCSLSFGIKLFANIWWLFFDNNLFLYSLLAMVEGLLLTMYFYELFKSSLAFKMISLMVLIAINLYLFLSADITVFNSPIWTFNSFWLLSLALYFFFFRFKNIDSHDQKAWPDPAFIISAGLLLYFSGSFFVYLMGWYLLNLETNGFFANGWIIVSFAVILKSFCISLAIKRAS